MNLRNGILVGLALSVLTVLFTLGNILLHLGWFPYLMTAVVLWYGYCAIWRTSSRSSEDELSLHRGVKWGLAIGCLCAFPVLASPAIGPDFGVAAIVFALLLPFLAGALSAISFGKVRRGTSVGLWSGMVGGLIGFFVFTADAFLPPLLLGVPVFEALVRDEYWPFQFAIYSLFLYGPIFCPLAATVGGWIGIQLEKTGRPSSTAIPSGNS